MKKIIKIIILILICSIMNTSCVLAQSYCDKKDFQNAILNYKKAISMNPKDDSVMHSLAEIYIKTNQIEKAMEIYKKILAINPDDVIAKNNLKCGNKLCLDKKLSDSINNLKAENTAPDAIYRLLKPDKGVSSKEIATMKKVLDLTWSDPSGQIILKTLAEKKILINIKFSNADANSRITSHKDTLYLFGMDPIVSPACSLVEINIPVSEIKSFNDTKSSPRKRIYSLQVFIHEFGHAFINAKNPNDVNSLEEELGVSMIGYNIATKAITGKYLSQNQTKAYSEECLKAMMTDGHRDLPLYSGFINDVQMYGVELPYPQEYSNIEQIYKKLICQK